MISTESILIRRKEAAGDVLLATPVIAAFKQYHPNSQIFVETDHPEILRDNPDVTLAAKSMPPDHAYMIDLTAAYESRPQMNYLDAYAEAAAISVEDRALKIFPSAAERAYANSVFGQTDRWCVINAGNVCKNRVWPLERYAPVIHHLRSIGFKVAQVGTYDGAADCDLDFTRKTTIHQMAALIERCGLFIGIDSLPLHIACGVGATTLGLFGVTLPERVLSTRNNVWVVTSDAAHPFTGARHWEKTNYVPDCSSNPMETISSEAVINRINEIVFKPR